MELPAVFEYQFNAAFKASRYGSHRKLSLESRCNPSQAGKIAKGGFRSSKDGPSLFGSYRMAENLGVTLNDLLPPPVPAEERPGVEDFFARYQGFHTPISEFRDILEFCDVYAEPKNGRCQLISQGMYGLLAERTDIRDPVIHQATFDSWSPERRAKIFNWQRRAWEAGAMAEPEDFTGDYRSADRTIQILILRAGCRVLSDDLKPRLLIYCDQIGKKFRHSIHG